MTVLSVRRFTDFELIRDGGSLLATFESDDGGCHFLLFHIRSADGPGPNEATRMGFERPVTIDSDPAKRLPDTDTIRYSALSGPETPVTWSQALDLLSAIERSPDLDARQIEGLMRMRRAAEREGYEPATTVKTFRLSDLPVDRSAL